MNKTLPNKVKAKSTNQLKIGFLTYKDPLNRRSWSGVYYSMVRALERNVGEVVLLGPVQLKWFFRFGDLFNKLSKAVFNRKYAYESGDLISKTFANIFEKKLKNSHIDVIICPAASPELANLKTEIPIIYTSDATLLQLLEYYPRPIPLFGFSKQDMVQTQKKALNNADLVLYSSKWAADSAIHDLKIPAEKVGVLPFGANFPSPPDRLTAISKNKGTSCKLFFLGGEWNRKGGEIAFDAMVSLNKMGIDTSLTVVGCMAPDVEKFKHPKFTNVPYLNMGLEEDMKKLTAFFLEADFFILPSRAECAAIAFCDANSFGLPVFTTDTGGIASFVENGVNGFRLSLEAKGNDFAEKIYAIFKDDNLYKQLRINSRDVYEKKLNWDSWAIEIKKYVEMLLTNK